MKPKTDVSNNRPVLALELRNYLDFQMTEVSKIQLLYLFTTVQCFKGQF